MAKAVESVEVNVPLRTAYNQWTQFEEFPLFMDGVNKVHQIDDTHLHWSASIGGQHREWDAEITVQKPDERVAWLSTGGTTHAGEITFHPIGENKCRVTCELDFEPEGPIEGLGDMLGFVERQVKQDMSRFKEFIEARGSETGAWRGEVDRYSGSN